MDLLNHNTNYNNNNNNNGINNKNSYSNHYQYNYQSQPPTQNYNIQPVPVQYYPSSPQQPHIYISKQSPPHHQIVYSPPLTPPLHSSGSNIGSNAISPRSYHESSSSSSFSESESTMVPSYHSPSLYSIPYYHHHPHHLNHSVHLSHHHHHHAHHHSSPSIHPVIVPKIEIPPRSLSPPNQSLVSPSIHPPVLNLNDSSDNQIIPIINNNNNNNNNSCNNNNNNNVNNCNNNNNSCNNNSNSIKSESNPNSPVLSPKSNNKISEIIVGLIPICNELNNNDQVQNKVILNKLQESIEDALKEIKKIKKTRLPYPKPQTLKEQEEKTYISLRPRRNRKCTNKTKTLNPNSSEETVYCLACGTTKSPEWRKGPDGCKSLCNACGLYYAKTKKKENEISCQPELLPKLMKINNLIND